jgi:hypothetical protein
MENIVITSNNIEKKSVLTDINNFLLHKQYKRRNPKTIE